MLSQTYLDLLKYPQTFAAISAHRGPLVIFPPRCSESGDAIIDSLLYVRDAYVYLHACMHTGDGWTGWVCAHAGLRPSLRPMTDSCPEGRVHLRPLHLYLHSCRPPLLFEFSRNGLVSMWMSMQMKSLSCPHQNEMAIRCISIRLRNLVNA